MTVEIVQVGSADDIGELEPAWREIQDAGGVSDPMYTWEWMSTWWEIFGGGCSLCALILREAGRVVAIAPFVRRKVRMNRFFPFRRLELMGTGEPERDEVYSEYVDLPVRPGVESRRRGMVESLADELLNVNREHRWDDLVLHRVRPDSVAYVALRKQAEQRGLSVSHLSSGVCHFVTLPSTVEEYESQLSGHRRKRIRRGIRCLEKMGEVHFAKAETVEHALATLDLLAGLHQARWTARGAAGNFASTLFTEFHRRFIQRTFSLGWPELWSLRVDGEPIACRYNIRYQGKIASYTSGMKAVDDKRVAPGVLTYYFAIKAAVESGAKEYNFMLGDQLNKKSLSNATRELVTLRIVRSSVKERLRRAVVFAGGPVNRLVSGLHKRRRT